MAIFGMQARRLVLVCSPESRPVAKHFLNFLDSDTDSDKSVEIENFGFSAFGSPKDTPLLQLPLPSPSQTAPIWIPPQQRPTRVLLLRCS